MASEASPKSETTVVLEFSANVKISNEGYLSDKDPVKDHVEKALAEVARYRWHYTDQNGKTQPVHMTCRVKTVMMTPTKETIINAN